MTKNQINMNYRYDVQLHNSKDILSTIINETLLLQIIAIKKDKSVLWRYGKSKKQVLDEIQQAIEGLIVARKYLPANYVENLLGIPSLIMSYSQIREYVTYVIKTGKLKKCFS